MNIQFMYGKLDLTKLPAIDTLVNPTDTHCSGSGGLDQAIHQAAGPELSAALRGRQLSDNQVLVTDGFSLGVRYIVHAAVPTATPADSCAEALQTCYKNILWTIGRQFSDASSETAAIPLIGTGSCGWTFEQSMAALWSSILKYHREFGSSFFGAGTMQTLYIYYPAEAFPVVYHYHTRASQAFFHAPGQWGMRGDPYFWYALMYHFDDPAFNNISLFDFIKEIQRFFHKKTGKWLCGDTHVQVKEWAFGDISSFMAEIGIPILCSNLLKITADQPADTSPSFIIPVTLRCSHPTQYQLALPYELLPEFLVLRKKQHEINAKKRIPLGFGNLYFLTIHHYPNAPELIDFYSLDVEGAHDFHFHFSEKVSFLLCKQLGYAPNAIGAALSEYLRTNGGHALEKLVIEVAEQEFLY